MKLSKRLSLQLTEDELEELANELDDLGFGADDMSGKKQADEKWPTLSKLNECLCEEL